MIKTQSSCHAQVRDDDGRLQAFDGLALNIDDVAECVRADRVALLRNISAQSADPMLQAIAQKLRLFESLQIQAAYASVLGHRQRIGRYQMTVNARADYQFIPPHSEGDSFLNMQLASFHCHENTTDGGETILFNVNDSAEAWNTLRERVTVTLPDTKRPSETQLRRAKVLDGLRSTVQVSANDIVISHRPSKVPGLRVADVLTPVRKVRSMILDRAVYGYWVSVAIVDRDSLSFFVSLLEQANLLREPTPGIDVQEMDSASRQRIWSSGANFNQLFVCKIRRKLQPNELIVYNNVTWAHSASNWTPGSGSRHLAAAFA